ncbi:MAG: ABC transporter permease [Ferruginibacter sp.]
MYKNYIKIAWRNLSQKKGFTAINILGLAIGIATCLVILLFVQNELSFDRFNKKASQIVRVYFKGTNPGGKMNESTVMPPTALALKTDYPEVLEATRIRDYGRPRFVVGNQTFKDAPFAFVDSNFFQVFTLPLLQGDAKTALVQPNTMVITKALAKKYFGNEDPMGKTIHFKESTNPPFTITGVIDKVPDNAHFHFEMFASMAGFPDSRSSSWMQSEFYTYLVLQPGYDYKKLEAKLPRVVEKYMGPQILQGMGMTFEQFKKSGNSIGLFLQPLTDIHLHSDFAYDLSSSGDIRYVYIFSAIALFMLLIACINFMNLSTAGASKRAREVGIRKVLGSLKSELVRRFLVESVLITGIALLLAIGLVYLALPFFNNLAGTTLSLQWIQNPWLLPALLAFGLFVGVLAGSYPAFFLSSFKPIAVLKGKFTSGKKSIGLRSGLVVFQFFISITLMVSTAVVYRQLAYIQNKKLGFNKDQVLVLPETWLLGNNHEVFRQQLLQDPRIVSISTSGYLPAGPSWNNNFFVYPEDNSTQLIKTLRYDVDYNYIPTLGIEMKSGRNFSKTFGSDSSGVIMNESAAKIFGWEKDAIGHTISNTNNEGKKKTYRVIGVVKDFHFKSLHVKISPLVMVMGDNSGTFIAKIKTKDIAGLLATTKTLWDKYSVEEPFSYSFLDERFNASYKSEQKIGEILAIFAGLTIFVACLGLFGLATFTAEQRTKEIGIRKVLGASVSGVVALLSKDFLKLVGLAFIIASPIAWYVMDKWLQDFAYRISITAWVFIVTALIAIAIAIATVSFQAIKAAIANPVKSLRTE